MSWTSIATGAYPGGRGIFDFVHRDPATYTPYVSILPMRTSALGEQFVPPYTAKTFFEGAADLRDFGTISFRDIPFLAIGKHLDQSNIKPPSQAAAEGQKDLEERLKSLGFL